MSPHDSAVGSLLSRDPLFRRCLEAGGPLPEPLPRTPSGFPGLLRIILEQQVSTLAAEGDARERLALMLADQVVTRLLAAASGLPD